MKSLHACVNTHETFQTRTHVCTHDTGNLAPEASTPHGMWLRYLSLAASSMLKTQHLDTPHPHTWLECRNRGLGTSQVGKENFQYECILTSAGLCVQASDEVEL